MLNLYVDVIPQFRNKKYMVVLFTNGYSGDILLADKLIQALSKEKIDIKMLDRPDSAEILVKQISRFKGIITVRLHSCIVTYS